MDQYISKEVLELEGDEAKDIYKMNLFKAKRIIADSIKDHFIPHVSSLKTPKEVFDALTTLFEGKKHQSNDDIEELVEECEDTKLRDHAILLHKGFSIQGKN